MYSSGGGGSRRRGQRGQRLVWPELGALDLVDAVEHAQRRHVSHHRHLLRRDIDVERTNAFHLGDVLLHLASAPLAVQRYPQHHHLYG